MFYYLEGTVAEVLPSLAVVDCGGVGYGCMTTGHTLSALKKGEKRRLYTYLNVGESVFDLYGFATQKELESFRLLLGISGVGPKAALAILSANTPESLALAVAAGDEKALTAAPGIGKKIAQRIMLELRDKLNKDAVQGLGVPRDTRAVGVAIPGGKEAEAAAALGVLGYSVQEIHAALQGLDMEALPLEEIVRQGLKRMVK